MLDTHMSNLTNSDKTIDGRLYKDNSNTYGTGRNSKVIKNNERSYSLFGRADYAPIKRNEDSLDYHPFCGAFIPKNTEKLKQSNGSLIDELCNFRPATNDPDTHMSNLTNSDKTVDGRLYNDQSTTFGTVRNAKVSSSIWSPLQCYNCLFFGHTSKFCRFKPRCSHCGQSNHSLNTCPSSQTSRPCCFFCQLPHLATDRSCEEWHFQRDVKKIMITANISFKEAINLKKQNLVIVNNDRNKRLNGGAAYARNKTNGYTLDQFYGAFIPKNTDWLEQRNDLFNDELCNIRPATNDSGYSTTQYQNGLKQIPGPAGQATQHSNTEHQTAIGLIKNGSKSKFMSVKYNNGNYVLSNTCSFDTIIQMIAVAYCDSIAYTKYVTQNKEESTLFQLIFCLLRDGVTVQTYKKRVEILSNLYSGEPILNGITYLSVEQSMDSMLNMLLKNYESVQIEEKCSSCKFKRSEKKPFLTICVTEKKPTKRQLNLLINQQIKQLCTSYICQKCTGVIEVIAVLGEHIFFNCINLNNTTDALFTDTRILLNHIPKYISTPQSQYFLRGLGTTPDSQQSATSYKTIGHYHAHTFRNPINSWQIYDGIKEKVQSVNENTKVNLQIIMYSK